MLPREAGGYGPGLAGEYLLWVCSRVYNNQPKDQSFGGETNDYRQLLSWVQERLPQFCPRKLGLGDFARYRLPQVSWPLIIMFSVAYSPFITMMLGVGLPGNI